MGEQPTSAAGARQLAPASEYPVRVRTSRTYALYGRQGAMNENFSLVVMCLFLLASLAFLAQQLTSYH
jgi:hypothetical protein